MTMTEDPTDQVEGESPSRRRTRLLTKAHAAASVRLRNQYKDEFEKLYVQEASALGVEYTPRMTAEQRAEQTLRTLLEAHPHLRETLSQ